VVASSRPLKLDESVSPNAVPTARAVMRSFVSMVDCWYSCLLMYSVIEFVIDLLRCFMSCRFLDTKTSISMVSREHRSVTDKRDSCVNNENGRICTVTIKT
jgi:hypothetical protein